MLSENSIDFKGSKLKGDLSWDFRGIWESPKVFNQCQ